MNGPKVKKKVARKQRRPFGDTQGHFMPYALLVCGALLLYGWTATFDFGLDDMLSINPVYTTDHSFEGLISLFSKWYAGRDYRPVVLVSFWLQRLFFGIVTPGISHFVNVLLFAFLLTRIYRFILVGKFLEDEMHLKTLALLAAILFLVHPNHVSVVANIKSRDNLLSMMFGLMAAIQLIRVYDERTWWRLIPGILLLFVAFLSKLDAYAFAVAPALVIFLFRTKLSWNRKIFIQAALLILGAFILYKLVFAGRELLTSRLPHTIELQNELDPISNPLVGNFGWLNRLSLSLTSLFYYLKFLVVPWGYYFYFGGYQVTLLPLFHVLNIFTGIVFLFAISGSIYYAIKKKNNLYLFACLFFLMSIAYASNYFVAVSGIIMDRYNFIPSLGFCLALAYLFMQYSKSTGLKILASKYVAVAIIIFSGFTCYRTSAWKNNLTLFTRDIEHLDRSFHANKITGSLYINMALDEIERRDPDKVLADRYMETGKYYILKADSIYNRSPSVWVSFGLYNLYHGNDRAAATNFKKCLDLDSNYVQAYNKLGVAYRNQKMTDSAIYYFSKGINKEREYSLAASNLIDIFYYTGKKEQLDSLVNVLTDKYPYNPSLKNKIRSFY